MNKKNLSVVMAGAMLATSVAPVLADTTTDKIPESQKDLLVYGIVNKMDSLKLSSNEKVKTFVDGTTFDNTKGESVYGVQVVDSDGNPRNLGTATTGDKINYNIENVKSNLKSTIQVGDTVKVYERGYSEFLGQLVATTKPVVSSEADKYTAEDIKNTYTQYKSGKGSYIKSAKLNETETSVTLTLNTLENISDETSNKTLTLTAGEPKVNLDMPLDKDGNLLTDTTADVHKWASFLKADTYTKGAALNTKKEISATKVVVDDSTTEATNLLVSDLYDGTMLTSKGTEIVNELVAAKEANPSSPLVKLEVGAPSANASGVCEIKIGYYKNTGDSTTGITKAYKVVTIRSTDEDEAKALYNLLNDPSSYNVGVVGGNNRYETAVNVAKTRNISLSEGAANNIVLVNGTSLVDGLAAAPLVNTFTDNSGKTPLLLTEADKLPTATKDYIKSLTDGFDKDARAKVTVTLVGGESVLTISLVDELEGMGFKVARLGGDNREETSLEVAEKITALNSASKNSAFVVGANGEADAMSISAEAFNSKTPIIVSSVHGLTKDAIKYLGENPTATATIIGGEAVVSKDEEAKIEAVKDEKAGEKVTRIAGSNRFETNAKVIETYKKTLADSDKIAVVKDGQNNKSELVDALTASTLGNPVILATDKLSDVQKNALIKANVGVTHTTSKLYQIGNGVNSSVMKSLSDLLGIKNKTN